MAAKRRVPKTSRWKRGLAWGIPGALIGLVIGVVATGLSQLAGNDPAAWTPLIAVVLMGGGMWALKAYLIEGSGDLAGRVYMGADQGTSPEYSVARGLEIRGQYEAAVEAFAAGADEYPEDPEPLLAGARLLRDPLERYDEALEWLQRARTIPELRPREQILIAQEMVELYEGPLDDPARALPLLVEMTERHAGTRPAEWAARRLTSLRTELWENVRDDELADYTDYQRSTLGWDERAEEETDDGER